MNENMSPRVEETATFGLAGAVVTVASSVLTLIDESSGIRLFSIHINLNGANRQINKI